MRICAYVHDRYTKEAYKVESHDVRAWPGFEMVLDAIRRGGYTVEYAGKASVHKYDVVLVSITADCDWWPFMAERATWKPGPYTVVAGGAGVLNVRPFLPLVDIFVLGRGENLICDLLAALQKGERFEHESVVNSSFFDPNGSYTLAQATERYPHTFTLTNGKKYCELKRGLGCPHKCLFCGYTWHRKYIPTGGELYEVGPSATSTGTNSERTMIELLKYPASDWKKNGDFRIVGLDGMSERLRFMVNKRISREMVREFYRNLASLMPVSRIRLYNIVGYPTETEDDWEEFIEDLTIADESLSPGKKWGLDVHFTPFRPMPCTPAAVWPMAYRDYRGNIGPRLQQEVWMKRLSFFDGNRLWAREGHGTESLPTVILSAACLRGTEDDGEIMRRIAATRKFWTSNVKSRIATLERYLDIDRLFGSYTWDNLPTRYLHSYVSRDVMIRLSAKVNQSGQSKGKDAEKICR